jgi:O-antigen/teichoic acid export membrane protein
MADTAYMYGASIGGGGLQYLALIVIARALGPAPLGGLVVATTIAGLVAASVEFGIGTVLVRYHAPLSKSDPQLWGALSGFLLRIVGRLAAGIAALGVIAGIGLDAADASTVTVESVCGGLILGSLTLLFTYFQNYLQAQRRFAAVAAPATALPLLRLIAVVLLSLISELRLSTILVAYVISIAIVTVWTWLLLPAPRMALRVEPAVAKRARLIALRYMRWTSLGRAFDALAGRLDVIMLALLAGSAATGIYGASWQTAAPIVILASSVHQVAFPHLVANDQYTDRDILRRWARWLPVLIAGGLAAAAFGPLLPHILGSSFGRSVLPFQLLAIAFTLDVWLAPVAAILYATDRQRYAAMLAAGQLATIAVLNLILIPPLGPKGPAIAFLTSVVLLVPATVVVILRRPSGRALRDPDVGEARPPDLPLTRSPEDYSNV